MTGSWLSALILHENNIRISNSYYLPTKTNEPADVRSFCDSWTSCWISSLSKSCYSHIHELRPYLDSKTASSIAASIVHSKLDYCNSLCYNLPKSLQQIQNCLARTVVKAPISSHIIPILRSLHWLKINERIEYKLLSLTYKVLTILSLCSVYR